MNNCIYLELLFINIVNVILSDHFHNTWGLKMISKMVKEFGRH